MFPNTHTCSLEYRMLALCVGQELRHFGCFTLRALLFFLPRHKYMTSHIMLLHHVQQLLHILVSSSTHLRIYLEQRQGYTLFLPSPLCAFTLSRGKSTLSPCLQYVAHLPCVGAQTYFCSAVDILRIYLMQRHKSQYWRKKFRQIAPGRSRWF